MALNFSVTLTIDEDVLSDLKGFTLNALKAVECDPNRTENGNPVIWFSDSGVSTNQTYEWQENLQVYGGTSKVPLAEGVEVSRYDPRDITYGQTLLIQEANGHGKVDPQIEGRPGFVTIATDVDKVSEQIIGGCCTYSPITKKFAPTCAFPMINHTSFVFKTIQKVLFFFSSKVLSTGSILYFMTSDAILVDLTNEFNQTITFTKNGWKSPKAGRIVKSYEKLTNVLILPNPLAQVEEKEKEKEKEKMERAEMKISMEKQSGKASEPIV